MNTKWTLNDQSVQCNLLIFIAFGFDCTLLVYFAGFLLLSIGGGVLWWQWTLLQKRVNEYILERNALRNDFYEVLNIRFPVELVVVNTETKEGWLKKMNIHYASGRMVVLLLKREKGQTALDYDDRAKEEKLLWEVCHHERIIELKRQRAEWLDTLDENGFLDYFKRYQFGKWKDSKKFLEADLAYFRNNPRPIYLGFRKEKLEELEHSPQLNK
jgi:hypothetical protein